MANLKSGLLLKIISGLYILLFASLPFSLALSVFQHEIELPSEPLLVIISALLLLYLIRTGLPEKRMIRSWIVYAGLAMFLWMGLTTPFSSHFLVSLKYLIISGVHFWVFFCGPLLLFGSLPNLFFRLALAYGLSFLLILLFSWTVHYQYGFSIDTSVLVARPFYFDHALLSCCILLLAGIFLPGILGRFGPASFPQWLNHLAKGSVLLLFVGLILTFSRAGWLSALIAFGALGLVLGLKLRFRQLLIVAGSGLLCLLFFWPMIWNAANQNLIESKKGNWWEHIASVTNIRTDVSNLERLNRYSCAWRMFKDRPVLGFGPGTFQFAFLPYQREEEMTRISVTTPGPFPPGRGGRAHSEYLQALSEMGLPGFLIFLFLLLACLASGLDTYYQSKSKRQKVLVMGLLFGLLTYFTHGLFNNFLSHGKVAALVWTSIAMLVIASGKRENEDSVT